MAKVFVWVFFRLPSILLRDTSGNVQESDELAGNFDISTWGPNFRKGQGSDPQVKHSPSLLYKALFSSFFAVIIYC